MHKIVTIYKNWEDNRSFLLRKDAYNAFKLEKWDRLLYCVVPNFYCWQGKQWLAPPPLTTEQKNKFVLKGIAKCGTIKPLQQGEQVMWSSYITRIKEFYFKNKKLYEDNKLSFTGTKIGHHRGVILGFETLNSSKMARVQWDYHSPGKYNLVNVMHLVRPKEINMSDVINCEKTYKKSRPTY